MTSNNYVPLLKNGASSESPLHDVEAVDIQIEHHTEEDHLKLPLQPAAAQLSPRSALEFNEPVPPEWAVLLLGCALGLATGASVVLFNLAVHGIHNLAWAGTPAEGAAWLRVQPLATTWHRIMLIPVLGGVVVGMLHALSGILEQSRAEKAALIASSTRLQQLRQQQEQQLLHPAPQQPQEPFQLQRFAPSPFKIDWGKAARPAIKAVQAAVTLGTGSSLGPEGPSVDIGKAWAGGMAEILRNTKERKMALVAAGAAAGISSGFNAAVAGCFFAIETVLQSVASENSPPLTTAMIILASVLSSTVSNVVLGEEPAFTVPEYELKSAAELPLYLLLGMVCGIIAVIFTRLIQLSTRLFQFLRDRLSLPPAVTPALGGLCVGFIALQYPGVLYWGFSNVNEILHSRESASAPGPSLMAQIIAAKIVATALCRGSGLVGGIYAPSLFIGSAVGSVYGSLAGAAINAAVQGKAEIAAPQAYALVGMAAMLASVCSVPLTSVLLLFELTKDYRILLPLMGAVGLAYWVSSVANRSHGRSSSAHTPRSSSSGPSPSHSSALYAPLGHPATPYSIPTPFRTPAPLHGLTSQGLSPGLLLPGLALPLSRSFSSLASPVSTSMIGPINVPGVAANGGGSGSATSSPSYARRRRTSGRGGEDVEMIPMDGGATAGEGTPPLAILGPPLTPGAPVAVEAAVAGAGSMAWAAEFAGDRLLDELKVSSAMASQFCSVPPSATVKDAAVAMLHSRQRCALLVDEEGFLQGMITLGDLQREAMKRAAAGGGGAGSRAPAGDQQQGQRAPGGDGQGSNGGSSSVSKEVQSLPVSSLALLRPPSEDASPSTSSSSSSTTLPVCFPEMSLRAALQQMLPMGLQQLPVVSRSGKRWQDRGRRVVGLVEQEGMRTTCQTEATRRMLAFAVQ